MAAALAGACAAFLVFNFHPARVFMGDGGSMLLGFVIAGVAINGVMKTTAAIAVVAPLFVLAIPILDTSFVIMKRIKHGLPVYSADRSHFHHRFFTIGWGQRKTVLALYAWCVLMGLVAIVLRFVPYRDPDGGVRVLGALTLAGVGLLAVLAVGLHGVRARDPEVAQHAGGEHRAPEPPGARAARRGRRALTARPPRPRGASSARRGDDLEHRRPRGLARAHEGDHEPPARRVGHDAADDRGAGARGVEPGDDVGLAAERTAERGAVDDQPHRHRSRGGRGELHAHRAVAGHERVHCDARRARLDARLRGVPEGLGREAERGGEAQRVGVELQRELGRVTGDQGRGDETALGDRQAGSTPCGRRS